MRTPASVWRRAPLAGALLIAPAVLGGCENSVDPTLGTEQAFTIWGALDPTAGQQALRVVPIQGAIDADPAEIDAEVTATDLTTGETVAFRDSFVTFEAGTSGHVFLADWAPQFDRAYRLDVRRTADDARATAEVRTPKAAVPAVSAGISVGNSVEYQVRLGGVPRVQFGQLVFRVSGHPSAPRDTIEVLVEDRDPVEVMGLQWGRDVTFIPAVQAYFREAGLAPRTLVLVDVTYRMYVTNAEWVVPEGGFDLDQIVEPGTVSNVTGGFGFVGAGYWTEVSWVPALSTQVRAGFFVADDPASQVVVNEIGLEGWVELYNPTLETVSLGGYGISMESGVPPRNPFFGGTLIEPKGFLVVELGVPIEFDATVYFVTSEGVTVGALALDGDLLPSDDFDTTSYGSFPDVRSLRIRDGAGVIRDLFQGVLRPTRGEPNALRFPFFVVNEVAVEAGADGWVEIYNPPELLPPPHLGVASSVEALLEIIQTRPPTMGQMGNGLAVVLEQEGLDLDPQGGEIYVVGYYAPTFGPPPGFFLADVRAYGPQTAGTSSGLLPDGLDGVWTTGLVPSPNALNAPLP